MRLSTAVRLPYFAGRLPYFLDLPPSPVPPVKPYGRKQLFQRWLVLLLWHCPGFSMVICGLDSIAARRWINNMLVWQEPLATLPVSFR
jgi:hypothetical protein